MKTRNSAFELLRIIAMYLIVLYHATFWGPLNTITELSVNRGFTQLFAVGGKLGVNLFVMISGYFLIQSHVTPKKLIPMWKQVFTYSAGFFVLFLIINHGHFQFMALLRGLLPVIFNEYWFVTTYIMLYLLAPYLNQLIKSLSRVALLKLVALLTGLTSILPSIFQNQTAVSELGWFILLYVIAAYLRLYGIPTSLASNQRSWLFLGGSAFILAGSILTMDLLGRRWPVFQGKELHFAGQESILLLLLAIAIFIRFMQLKPFSNSLINRLATLTFGVYLIHDNEFIRPLLWQHWVPEKTFYASAFYPLHLLLSVLAIYLVASVLEFGRQRLSTLWLHTKQHRV
ncbi:hypothetical protein C5Z25_06310 [Lactobacillus sp. CBA3605]|uniref:acyltransferase family protein n=1 Tax=Lactobacillus sp. CBA3605 TaxID=2099788 RepID=UPI000CFABAC0|nr:acyltransferase [Lactobacillus sp. CBA3605]AVK61405.1 hypothetical protein C5Z25_06310 [Lactobacillus sp. CBA3605]